MSRKRNSSNAIVFCTGKQAYDSLEIAKAVAGRKTGRGYSYSTYKCTECGKWHLGHHSATYRAARLDGKAKRAETKEKAD